MGRERSHSRNADRRRDERDDDRHHRDRDRGKDSSSRSKRGRADSRERGGYHDHHATSSRRRSRSRSRSRDRKRDRRHKGGREEEDSSRKRSSPERGRSSSYRHHQQGSDRRGDKGDKRRRSDEKEAVEKWDQKKKGSQESEQQRQEQQKDEEEDHDAPLELDEESMLLMMGDDQDEEERRIAERQRKRQEIEALHRKKQEEEEKALKQMTAVAGAMEGGSKPQGEGKTEKQAGDSLGRRKEEPNSDEEEEDDGLIEVTVHNKPLTEDEAVRNGQPEPDEEPGFLLDMFSLSPGKALGQIKAPAAMLSSAAVKGMKDAGDSLEDNWDDHEGYYKTMVGELIADRYLVLGSIGRGVFSTVLKCVDKREDDAPVAIKIIRNNEVMRKAAQKELDLLREISAGDPENRKHCVRLLDHFEHRNHVALVFESLQMNLRETLRKFGKHVGINISAVRTYAKQLLVALRHIGNLRIVHADIKPDNILVSEGFSQLKICDFGSAFKENAPDNDPTPYLVSRFYRAPEIILGFEYDRAVDLWSIGCCLYELFTGRVTFPGCNNNEMLRLMMEVKGGLPQKLIRRHRAAYEKLQLEPLFESDGRFRQQEFDPVSKKPIMRIVHVSKPMRELTATLMKAKAASDDRTMVLHLADLLEKIFTLDPSKRISVKEALHHPFVSASAAAASSNGTNAT